MKRNECICGQRVGKLYKSWMDILKGMTATNKYYGSLFGEWKFCQRINLAVVCHNTLPISYDIHLCMSMHLCEGQSSLDSHCYAPAFFP